MDYQYPIRRVSGRCIGRCTVKTFSGRNPSMKFQTVNVPPSAASVCYVSHGYSSGGASLPFTKSLMTPTRALNTPVVANLLSSLFIYLHKYLQTHFCLKKGPTTTTHMRHYPVSESGSWDEKHFGHQ